MALEFLACCCRLRIAVVFRFAQQVGMLPLTGTTNAQHMKEDLACDRFTLTAEELQAIETVAL